jgi:LacI family transcriptional regulator
VPADLTVAGFDDTPLATTVWPALTTVRQPIAEMAREAVRLLIDQIRKGRTAETAPVRHKLLKFTLIERESTAPPRNATAAKSGAKSKVTAPKP